MSHNRSRPIWTKQQWMARGAVRLAVMFALLIASINIVPTASAQANCDSTYTVRPGDTLSRIARQCATALDVLLDANPDITNPNFIRVGQTIQIPTTAPPSDGADNETPGEPQVLLVPSSGAPGTEIEVRISGFPAEQELALGLGIEGAPLVHSINASTNAQGRVQTSHIIPDDAQPGERWTVTARDTSPGGVEVVSNPFLVGTGDEAVSISPVQGAPGTLIQVTAAGFPAEQTLQVGIGRYGSEPVAMQSAQSDALGNVSASIALPDNAEIGSEWAVVVGTEDWRISDFSEIFQVTDDTANGAPVNGEPDAGFVLHTVQRGEWLSRIARQYETTVAAILAINPDISNPSRISVGQQIRVPSDEAPEFTQITIYLLALNDGGARGPEIGCNDSIVPVDIEIEPTTAPLQAALERLLEADGSEYDLSNVFTSSNLVVDAVEILNREAIIELAGELHIGGVCDHPRIEEQLARTALQFDTVDSVSVYVNGEALDDILDLR